VKQVATILVVEDEAPIRELVAATLKKDGYKVIDASNPTEALSKIRDRYVNVELLLTDLAMPGKGGVEFAVELLQTRPGLKIIYTSGSEELEKTERSEHAPPGQYLAKPYSIADLRSAITAALGKAHER
jgi:two-component system, cell cycle sensor histidine kinase and response regulator CckA